MDCHIFFSGDGAGDMESGADGGVRGQRRSAPMQGRTARPQGQVRGAGGGAGPRKGGARLKPAATSRMEEAREGLC